MEIFKPIAGFPNYQVSNQGRVLGPRGRVLAQSLNTYGYPTVSLYAAGKPHTKLVHRLVTMAFVPGDHALTVNHKNGVKTDNAPDNLEWMTQANNVRHACNTGLSPTKLTDNERAELFADYLTYGHTQQVLATKYGINSSGITRQLKALRPSRLKRAVAEHGSAAMYTHHGCRCVPCRAAKAEYARQYRKRKSAMIQSPLTSTQELCYADN
jgi:hypothetical protein